MRVWISKEDIKESEAYYHSEKPFYIRHCAIARAVSREIGVEVQVCNFEIALLEKGTHHVLVRHRPSESALDFRQQHDRFNGQALGAQVKPQYLTVWETPAHAPEATPAEAE